MLERTRRNLLAFAALAAFGAASIGEAAAQPKPLTVVATTAMVGDAVRAVGGERVKVEVLLGEGVDPHLYKPTRADIGEDARRRHGGRQRAQSRSPVPRHLRAARQHRSRSCSPARSCRRTGSSPTRTTRTSPTRMCGWTRRCGPASSPRSATRSRPAIPPERRRSTRAHDAYVAELRRPRRLRKTSARIDPEREARPRHRP